MCVSNPGPQPALRVYSLLFSSQPLAEMLTTWESLTSSSLCCSLKSPPCSSGALNEPLWLLVREKVVTDATESTLSHNMATCYCLPVLNLQTVNNFYLLNLYHLHPTAIQANIKCKI